MKEITRSSVSIGGRACLIKSIARRLLILGIFTVSLTTYGSESVPSVNQGVGAAADLGTMDYCTKGSAADRYCYQYLTGYAVGNPNCLYTPPTPLSSTRCDNKSPTWKSECNHPLPPCVAVEKELEDEPETSGGK